MRGVQTYRNPKLVHILDKLGFVENFGTGISRTIEAYSHTEDSPVFESSENFFYVTLPNLNYSDEINDEINDLGLAILKVVKKRPGIKVPEIVDLLKSDIPDVNLNKVRNEIRRNLQDYIVYEGPRKTGGYFLR